MVGMSRTRGRQAHPVETVEQMLLLSDTLERHKRRIAQSRSWMELSGDVPPPQGDLAHPTTPTAGGEIDGLPMLQRRSMEEICGPVVLNEQVQMSSVARMASGFRMPNKGALAARTHSNAALPRLPAATRTSATAHDGLAAGRKDMSHPSGLLMAQSFRQIAQVRFS
mmetsp:Transcript_51997/g.117274  ORF Transcript_51997/g.117274 Transcript_51997/m.117274 type:complete len:167 (-) Transcript_51997:17-517(-)